MTPVITGFGIIAFAIFVGWLLGRRGIVKPEDRFALNKVAFFAASPALLFTVLAKADLAQIFSISLATHVVGVIVVCAGCFVLMRALGTSDVRQLMVASYCGVYSNANNIGLPIAVYVIGDGSQVAPLLVLQMVVLAPILMGVLDAMGKDGLDLRRLLLQPVINPIVLGSALGMVFSAFSLPQPQWLMRPLELVGGAAVPLMLIAFGISLVGQKPLQPGTGRRDVLIATVAKTVVLPLVVYGLGRWVFGLDTQHLFAATVLAALPTAQNMYQYALRYECGEVVARDTVAVTTGLALPISLVVSILLRP
ncbi:AEC family transporter [uncultured Tessaracoccus sp.]|uniref:AEC family transporter n=1 Tax=uncultured Tessaracoccus sp. TaxID=905023 RepID=UPI002607C3E2|nr:AEC family transporter [uncultured Tessaracoccus sp.]